MQDAASRVGHALPALFCLAAHPTRCAGCLVGGRLALSVISATCKQHMPRDWQRLHARKTSRALVQAGST